MQQPFDRNREDLGNMVGLEHVNVQVPDQQLATVFYVSGLGLTRDPYLMTGIDNMWINVGGRSQFHLPTGPAQVLRGHVGLVLPDRAALLRRLERVREPLAGTAFAFRECEGWVEVTSPWGNRHRCFAPEPRFGPVTLAMPYVELEVPVASAEGISRFYRDIVGAPATVRDDGEGRRAIVSAGPEQALIYRETAGALPAYDGHHIQVYVADFAGPHRRLGEYGLISEESDQHQYRFKEIVDPAGKKPLFTLEHEVRSMRHPLFARPLVNRDPAQTNRHYRPGFDELRCSMPAE